MKLHMDMCTDRVEHINWAKGIDSDRDLDCNLNLSSNYLFLLL
jgi:hypothetical protein